MTDKELKRLNRSELLQLLLEQTQENEQLREEMNTLQAQLDQHRITCEASGTLAEAALAINRVFEAADQAAQKYVQEVQERVADRELKAHSIISEAQTQADVILAEAEEKARKAREEADACLKQARAEADACLAKAKAETEEYWKRVNEQIQTLLKGHETLTALLKSAGRK